jgi:hypothetical protein
METLEPFPSVGSRLVLTVNLSFPADQYISQETIRFGPRVDDVICCRFTQ